MIRQQDDELDQLGLHVERLGGLGREIHGELESQSRMLDELVQTQPCSLACADASSPWLDSLFRTTCGALLWAAISRLAGVVYLNAPS